MLNSPTWARTALVILLSFYAMPMAQAQSGFSVVYGNPPAPLLNLETLNGELFDLKSLHGRAVVVNFWATWCAPCVEEMPALERMRKILSPEGLALVAVNAGEFEETIESFLANFDPRLEFTIVIDKTSETFKSWNVQGLPVTYVVDKQGKLAYSAVGARPMDGEHIVGLLRQLIKRESH